MKQVKAAPAKPAKKKKESSDSEDSDDSSEEEKKKCLWPMNHADKRSYKEKKSVRGMDILDQHGVKAAGLSILTRRQKGENFVNSNEVFSGATNRSKKSGQNQNSGHLAKMARI